MYWNIKELRKLSSFDINICVNSTTLQTEVCKHRGDIFWWPAYQRTTQFWELDDVWLRMVMSCSKYFSNSAGSWKMSEYQTSWHSWIGKNIALMSVFMPRAIHIQLERLKHERTPRRLNMFGRSRNMPFAAHRAELAQ